MRIAIRGIRVVLHAASVLSVLGLLPFAAESAQAQTKIIEGYVSEGALQWPEYVGKEKGWFKENGIDLEMIAVGGGAAQQLAAGAINLGYSGFPDFIRATNQGAHIKIVINGVNTPPYEVFGKPAIKSVGDLKGKIISVGGSKDVTLVYINALLATAGLHPSDADYVYAKATPDRLAALMSGGVDAAILYPPATFKAAASGFSNLGNIAQLLKDFPFTVWAANMDWANAHKDAMSGYIKAYSRAVNWLYDQSNKNEAGALLVKYSKASPDDAAKTYDYFIKNHAYSEDGLISAAGYKKMTDALISFEDLNSPAPPMTTFVDDSFVKGAWNK